ncbi:glycosyltransferase [Sphingobacterium oryzagri]|uniref:Glycosyltransferase n=1 Tax=Sphingobacterium oryzagri TaxID=3025669 RepID=A0ABY7WFF2_9SPHI|nr:glycosyltransferase [Sphingobacterium sp. KACC 22765]WDF68347.1 glycosyltransferase [Sphingobacterium sp. KACC 22765]
MKKISRKLQPIALWLSLHDTSPTVKAEKRAVYCHNSFPFLKWNFRDLVFAPNIVLFALFSKFFYRVNIHQNDFVIVQQEWFRTAFIKLFNLNRTQIIVSPPDVGTSVKQNDSLEIPSAEHNGIYTFIYPAIADSHKNFECICRAAELLWKKGVRNFRVLLTIKGDENRYAKWLYANWGKDIPTIEFLGYLDRSTLFSFYEKAQSLIFASKVETWGLPITEFSAFKKPMLLADLPYARETAQGADMVVFFDVNSPDILANYMQELIEGNTTSVHSLDKLPLQEPYAVGWPSLFSILLS